MGNPYAQKSEVKPEAAPSAPAPAEPLPTIKKVRLTDSCQIGPLATTIDTDLHNAKIELAPALSCVRVTLSVGSAPKTFLIPLDRVVHIELA